MNLIQVEMLGIIAGIVCTSGFIFQLIKGYRTKKMDDVSLGMLASLIFGMSLWIIYGHIIDAFAVIVTNGFAVMCCISMLFLRRMYNK